MIKKETMKKGNEVKVTFMLSKDHPHKKSSVVGEFNDWDPAAHPMKKNKDGTFSASMTLPVGKKFAFRYLCEGDQWCNDEMADGYEPSSMGSVNCVLRT
ncbi:isoamylase early set domain-containing protein [Candidatus Acetothermia bacterium]|nr:isoamylase early set domain-containing protein [Candidatus Acetothermia bacterium]MBI3660855.1 isoamylase early set domain-containing protein [Candidatus Acetothermia bacterium]